MIRVYLVTVRGRVAPDACDAMTAGLHVGTERLQARAVTIRKASARETHLVVELVEGRNREIRRLMSAIGHEVTRLRRVQVGGLSINGLAPGRWRRVSRDELARAFPGAENFS